MSGRYDVEKSRAADGAPLVGAPVLALELPGRVALRVQVVAIESRRHAVPIEFDLELHLIALHRLAADRAGRAVSRPTERAGAFAARIASSAMAISPCGFGGAAKLYPSEASNSGTCRDSTGR